jgi:hypothetical protein
MVCYIAASTLWTLTTSPACLYDLRLIGCTQLRTSNPPQSGTCKAHICTTSTDVVRYMWTRAESRAHGKHT